MIAALANWAGSLLREQTDRRLTGLTMWARRGSASRGYEDWRCPTEIGGPEPTPIDDEASQRADLMLRDELGSRYAVLARQGYLDVPSTLFRHTSYRLRMRRPIEVFKSGRRQPWRLCIVSIERVPPPDELLMKLLWLRANEEYVLATANRVR